VSIVCSFSGFAIIIIIDGAIWDFNDHFGSYVVAARGFFQIQLIFDDVNDFVWTKFNWLMLKLRFIWYSRQVNALVCYVGILVPES